MKILIVGSGAREHAIARALHRSPQHPEIFCCGTANNPGIKKISQHYWVGDICNTDAILKKAQEWQADLVFIGPEAPLEKGLADVMWENGIPAIGPKKKLAQLETSKSFTRDLLKKHHVPGAPEYRVFQGMFEVKEFLHHLGSGNYVIKANGLMGGKGVKVAGDHLHSFQEALAFCEEILAAGQSFVIEEKFIGQEFSFLCFSDGTSLVPMPLVQDHKRAFVNDEGPNTGGMGSYSAANHRLPFLTETEVHQAHLINEAVLNALTVEFREKYIGILYGSFIATKKGVRLIEYNARFGDPEAMNVLAILESDFVAICQAMVSGRLSSYLVNFANLATVCKYLVPNGYPVAPVKNVEVDLSAIKHPEQLYLAAVDERDGKLYATGSRTVAVVGIGETIADAERAAEAEVHRIQGPFFHREDIGTEALINKRVQQMRDLRI